MQESERQQKTKHKFTAEEDHLLEALVSEKGENAWDQISYLMPGRNSRQVKDRWTRYLSPDINKADWTFDEEELLIKLVKKLNFHWVNIAKHFKGRTDNQIKNKWNNLKKYVDFLDVKKERTCKQNLPAPPKECLSSALNTQLNSWTIIDEVFRDTIEVQFYDF
ncbi:Myb-like DNA-binding domain containing protein [Trichomonas vaginalis G3]|uniref:Myb-like DNA-binding domain containing protein n=1 Tax=Trichomonas vaginalis (strain ATCC PRA-98 / G3) TaxID=412133 RepID=A2DJU8_TRIV3|nr:RNA polymerase II transcription regulator recruiting protein [Trichomonas vaginalis G3]EAY19312.1 Myb-like DNA-binding domain containing protein [Trichomonas vaginalis G3]KAI5527212.1 RNA polymerase II transcription regulator recruiting protein [Trichomonas vaginalis G3]|eukprot:XP_001580298.1 Myb-like DNA-binding domain containing protein [Trichomonas vaginalis G3]